MGVDFENIDVGGRSLVGVDFENVAAARVLGMSDLEMLLWLESGAHRKLHMLI